jgi:hypothetical protein
MRNNKMILMTFLAACSLGFLTTGCSSVKNLTGDSANKMVGIDATSADFKNMQVPEWFVAQDATETTSLRATATDISKDMQFAIDKATLSAKVQLAQQLNTNVSSLIRESTLESGYGTKDVDKQMDRVSKAKTVQDIAYYRRDKMKVVREGNYFRAYVLLTLDIDEARRLTNTSQGSSSREQLLNELDGNPQSQTQSGAQVSVVDSTGTNNTFQLLNVDNEEYKAKRAEALKKPGAVVGRVTVR